jgi:hypothetical protein
MTVRKSLAAALLKAAQNLDPPMRKKRSRANLKHRRSHQPQPAGFYLQLGALALPVWWDAFFPANVLVHADDLLKATGIAPRLEPPYWHCKDWTPTWNRLGYYRLDDIPAAIASDDIVLIEACESVTRLINRTFQWPYKPDDYPSRNAITAALKNNCYIATMVPVGYATDHIIANAGAGISG